MGRKSKRQKEIEEEFELHKQTLYQASRACGAPWSTQFEDDRLFAILCLCGYPAARAYLIAYPQSTASASSAAVLASRRLHDSKVQAFILSMLDSYWDNYLILDERCMKEKPPRWPAWRSGRKRNRFEPDRI